MKRFFQLIWLYSQDVPALYFAPILGACKGLRHAIHRAKRTRRFAPLAGIRFGVRHEFRIVERKQERVHAAFFMRHDRHA